MKKHLKDYVPFYIGHKIQSYWGEFKEHDTIVGIAGDLVILSIDDDTIESRIDISYKQKKGKEVKLVLRPLSDMTIAEAGHIVEKYAFAAVDMPMDKVAFAINICKRISDHTDVMMWLISKGFDVFGLIDSGLAVAYSKRKESNG